MPTYTSLNTQIDAVKSEITTSLAASTYSAQDLVYVAKALETLGNLIGVNDIVAATADAQAQLNTLVTDILAGTAPATAANLFVGTNAVNWSASAGLTNPVATFRYADGMTSQSYAQIAFTNADASSSTDIIAYANNGDDSSGWVDLGIAGDAFSDATYGITGAQDGYVFLNGKTPLTATISQKGLASNVATITTSTPHGFSIGKKVTITGVDSTFNGTYTIVNVPSSSSFTYAKTASNVGTTSASGSVTMYHGAANLVFATGSNGYENHIVFAAGGYSTGRTQMEIFPDQTVNIAIATDSTSTSTGALTVQGGVGIQGNLNVGGNVNITGTISFTGGGTTVQTANISVVDPAIFVAQDNTGNTLDFSFVGKYVSSGTKYTSFSKKASDGIWRLVSGLTVKPSTTVDYTNAVYDKIQVAQVIVNSTPSSDSEVVNRGYAALQRNDVEIAQLMGAF